MKKLLILLLTCSTLISCLKVDSQLTGENVTISGHITSSCNDSTPQKNIKLVLSDCSSLTQEIYTKTDSNGYFSINAKGSFKCFGISRADINGNSGTKLVEGFSLSKSQDIGTVFLNPCAKVVFNYDTTGYKMNLSKPFWILYEDSIYKSSIKSLAKPDSIVLQKYFHFTGYPYSPTFYTSPTYYRSKDASGKIVPSYMWQHVTVNVP